jgi:anti-anti-sigma regulatory factor
MSEIAIHDEQTQVTLKLTGVIDASHSGELLAAAITATGAGRPVFLEWSEAEHLHAGAFQVLLALNAELASLGHRLNVSACSPAVQDAMATAGFTQAFQPELARREHLL